MYDSAKEITIECEEILRVETNHNLGNNIRVTLSKPLLAFVGDIEAKEIICHMDANEALKAIAEIHGLEFIRDWHDSLGRS